ncbi:hypothetical protein Btru_064358 [Bulinus truncatus]|nr:hypothetical protein Btru_064358 [Bulinus truncatus]
MTGDPCTSNDTLLIQAVKSQSLQDVSRITYQLLKFNDVFSQEAIDHCLLYSSQYGPSVLVHSLLAAGGDLEARDKKCNTPLLISVAHNHTNISRLLLSKGANANSHNNNGGTALILSTYSSSSHCVTKVLLENQHQNSNGFTALACAIQVLNLEAIKLLVDANSHNNINFSCLNTIPRHIRDISKKNGILRVIRCLKLQHNTGEPALNLAVLERDHLSVHYINSMDCALLNYSNTTYLKILIELLKTINNSPLCDKDKRLIEMLIDKYDVMCYNYPKQEKLEATAMEWAVNTSHTCIVQLLCDYGFAVSNQVLVAAASTGEISILEILLAHKSQTSKANSNTNSSLGEYKESPLDKAIMSENFECAKLFLNYGTNIDISLAVKFAVESGKERCFNFLCSEYPTEAKSTIKSSNLLYWAHLGLINILLDWGAEINRMYNNKLPLMEASTLNVLDLLVSRGSDVNMAIGPNGSFQLILHYFVSSKYRTYLRKKLKLGDQESLNNIWAEMVKRLIYHGANIRGHDCKGRTPLRVAVKADDACKVIKLLLENGAEINEISYSGHTPLYVAVKCGQMKNVQSLLLSGANINASNKKGQTALFACCNVSTLKLLIGFNGDIKIKDNDGNSVLMHHLIYSDISSDLLTVLIDAGCDVNHLNKNGYSPLFLAASKLDPNILSILLQSGANINHVVNEDSIFKSSLMILMKLLWNKRDQAKECLCVLLDRGFNYKNIPSTIIYSLISVGSTTLVAKCISLGIQPPELNVRTTVTAWYRDTDEVKNLLATKKSLFSQDILDQCLLQCCQNGNVLFICALLSAGANIESVDDNGNTSLSLCALHSHPHCARLLLSAGANINTANYIGDTPLILSAIVHASLEMLKILLIKKDIDRELTNKKGKTALMCAVESVNVSAIKLLLDAGADYETKHINHEYLVCTNNELNNIARRKGIFNLLNLFKSEVAKKESAFLGAVLNRDLNSVQLLACMDHSLLDTNQMTLIDVILEFLKSIQKQNNAVSETEIEIFKLLLHYTQLDPQKVGDNHKIMHVAVSIGSVTLIELLSHRKFVISNEALGFAVFNPSFLQFLLSSSYLKADAIVQRTVPNYFGLSYPIYKGSALEKAMQGEQMISVKCLIQHGAYLNVYEALKFAIENSHESAVRFILQEYGGEALEKINCCGFLLSAVKNSSINIIKDLLNHGGDVNLVQYRVCPLTSALNVNKIDLLLSRGTDVNLEIKISEFYRQSYTYPLHFFVSHGFKDVLKKECLSKNLIDLDILESFLNSETENIIRSLLRHGAHVNAKDSSCFTPLHRAAQRENSSGIIKLLISSGAQVNGEYIRGVGAIHLAVESHCVENVRCLLEAGADVNSISVATGRNAVFDAKDYNILKLLLDHQADVNL